jgi:hypothetical protein
MSSNHNHNHNHNLTFKIKRNCLFGDKQEILFFKGSSNITLYKIIFDPYDEYINSTACFRDNRTGMFTSFSYLSRSEFRKDIMNGVPKIIIVSPEDAKIIDPELYNREVKKLKR